VRYIRLTTETLSGIPSIVFGLFGMLFSITALGLGYSLLSGTFTLAIMILPLIIRSTEEALKSVRDILPRASYGLGANRLAPCSALCFPSPCRAFWRASSSRWGAL
jgi:phosphate transport system permease protein